jgi:hypothetical protein
MLRSFLSVPGRTASRKVQRTIVQLIIEYDHFRAGAFEDENLNFKFKLAAPLKHALWRDHGQGRVDLNAYRSSLEAALVAMAGVKRAVIKRRAANGGISHETEVRQLRPPDARKLLLLLRRWRSVGSAPGGQRGVRP